MSSSNEFPEQAELAFASYASLSPGEPNQTKLQDSGRGLSIDQATRFTLNLLVITQYNHPTNSISAMIFADILWNKCLAVRSTDDGYNLKNNIIATLAPKGAALINGSAP